MESKACGKQVQACGKRSSMFRRVAGVWQALGRRIVALCRSFLSRVKLTTRGLKKKKKDNILRVEKVQ